ncbi:MAG: hypothetical protein KME20_16860 [Kaiparowitsia implicata GSE-PSE-MK54-09C]|jgi:hypothetical protein|nr:hypothetical protein [Kaiparowitsia implicata GSE-PSE-MK54-09C]
MTQPLNDPAFTMTADLLTRYSFDMGAFSAPQLVGYWMRTYPLAWVRAAIIEALYQGRYKSISVGQILSIWQRRGQPLYHFNFEFEQMICGGMAVPGSGLGNADAAKADAAKADAAKTETSQPADYSLDSPLLCDRPPLNQNAGLPDAPRAIAPFGFGRDSTRAEDGPSATAPTAPPTAPEGDRSGSAIAPSDQPESSGADLADNPAAGGHATPDAAPYRAATYRGITYNIAKPLTLKPISVSLADLDEWLHQDSAKQPIHHFIPDVEGSDFYEKLRAVAQGDESTSAAIAADRMAADRLTERAAEIVVPPVMLDGSGELD